MIPKKFHPLSRVVIGNLLSTTVRESDLSNDFKLHARDWIEEAVF